MFGLITGSYTNNLQGGVLRKNIWNFEDELQDNGIFLSSASERGSIVKTIDTLRIIGYNYGNRAYGPWSWGAAQGGGNCGWANSPLENGDCRDWGNPIGEMMYETLRYFAGKGAPTPEFTYSTDLDATLELPKPTWEKPTDMFPWCSKPFLMIISDVNPNYDTDQIPDNPFSNFSGDLADFDLDNLTSTISEVENISNTNHFIGETNGDNNFVCSSKNIDSLYDTRGLCPEEPTKKGGYYSAAIAYYAHTKFKENFADHKARNITEYSIALASPLPKIEIELDNHTVTLVPVGKSVSGCVGIDTNCDYKCNLTYDNNRGLIISNCQSDAYCPSNQIVDFYISELTPTTGIFRINFEDVEQGADHDMDAFVEYRYEVIDDSHVRISLDSQYASGCIGQVLGFVISGTTEDGLYLPVRDEDGGGDIVDSMPLTWEKTFTVSGSSPATLLKNPLWYASKWGAFRDINNNNIPDLSQEWDKDNDGTPDTYFFVANPLQLEEQLNKAFTDILKQASSGTSATVLSERTQAGATMLQALFYPEKRFDNTTLQWIGYLNALWLYRGNTTNSTAIREDTDHNYILDLVSDYIIHFVFKDNATLMVDRCQDVDGDGLCDVPKAEVPLDELAAIFEAGSILHEYPASQRVIYTNINNNKEEFSTANWNSLQPLMLTSNETETKDLINYIRGEDITGWRSRTVSGNVWKLGDITYSTPQVVSYENYSVILVGANDGMLHAFKLGKRSSFGLSGNQITRLCDDGSAQTCTTAELGRELWAYIPKNLLPYLRYLKDPDYCHLYYVDLTPFIFTWNNRKILIGGMRLGGACNCSGYDHECITPPAEANGTGLSAYFALDITTPTDPQVLWEFSHRDLGFTFSGPAVLSINGYPTVVFLSGPTHYDGISTNNLKVFVLPLDPTNLSILSDQVQVIDTGKANAFGGRLFLNKIGVDNNIYFGYTQGFPATNWTVWKGGVYKLTLSYDQQNNNQTATLTEVVTNIGPITSGVREGSCENSDMIFFSEGRYFSGSQDDPSSIRRLYGVHTQTCPKNTGPCTLSDFGNATDLTATWSSTNGWYIELQGQGSGYNAERSITDPLIHQYHVAGSQRAVVFFTTFQPTADICGFGGRTYEFMTKCSDGGGLGGEDIDALGGKLFLQVSTGQIKEFTCSDLANRRSEPVQGVPSEFPPTFVTPYIAPPSAGKEGKIIHWLEQ